MEIGLVRKIDINKEMQQSYLDYAMSVIVSRALPDARDGLKPVHRRILFAMYDMGLRPNTSYKKSARVVGEVLGKYHPHSDAAVYDAMARMAQDFSMRCPLVDGQGNFGSVDGDPPAAMRYTEARLTSSAIDMMVDIQKETVNFVANFDETMSEPSVLPAAIPNLLVNGATGIAVGMSTSVPPHNLGEVVNALIYMLSNWAKIDDITIEDLMRFIQGPDFPTGGIIVGEEGAEDRLSSAYGSGKGRITVQARAHVEDIGRGRQHIIVTELPYMTNKATLVERIAKLARTGTIEGISDLRDESDRQGMRIVIELGKNVDPDVVLTDLYKRTPMQSTFSIIMLALVDGEPRMLTLKQALKVYLDHRLEIIRRRSEHDLEKARQRAHLLEGYRIALDNLDEIIGIIRRSRDVDTARNNLIKRYKLSDIQANAILDMPLKRLSALERKKIDIEYKGLQKTIKGLLALLKAPKKMREKVAEELETVRENYGDRRRTQIVRVKEGVKLSQVLTASDLAPDETVWVTVTEDGKISRSLQDKSPRLSGKSAPKFVLRVNTRDTLYLVAENGEAAVIAVHALPDSNDPDQGVQVSKVCALRDSDTLADMFTIPSGVENKEKYYVLGVTKGGMVKKSSLEELPGPSSQTFTLIKVKGGDQLIRVLITDGASDLILATAKGMAIRFTEDAVRPMGLVAAGVNAIKLKAGDLVIGAELINPKYEVFLLASDGKAKRVKPSQFPIQGRYGQGVSAWKLEAGLQLNAMVVNKPNYKVIVHMARLASKAVRLDEAPVRGRPSNGKQVIEVKVNDQIVAVTLPAQTTLGLSKNVEETDLVFADDPKPTQIQMELKGSKKTAKKKGSKKRSSGKKKSAKK